MSNNITIELCAEDRARLDRLAVALEALQFETPKEPKSELQEFPAPPVTPPAEDDDNISPTPNVDHAQLMAKVIELSAKDVKLKAQVRDIVLAYAPRVKAVPEDKLDECYEKIVALEG